MTQGDLHRPKGDTIMATSVKEIMTPNPITLQASSTVTQAAEAMKQHDVGNVLVLEKDGALRGIVTDRDIVIRDVAERKNPEKTKLGDICSAELTTADVDDSIDSVVAKMREKALRRMPVVQKGKPVGIVSIGDLALERDERSALADISGAPPSH